MSNAFDKTINLGLGLLQYSRKKVDEVVKELVDKGEVAQKDARQFASGLMQRGEEQRGELKKLIQSEVTKALDHVNVARKEDLVTKDEIREIVREQVRQVLREQGCSKNESTK